jgi:hypothetical protein
MFYLNISELQREKFTEDKRDFQIFQASVLDFSPQGLLAIGNEVGRARGPEWPRMAQSFGGFSLAKLTHVCVCKQQTIADNCKHAITCQTLCNVAGASLSFEALF